MAHFAQIDENNVVVSVIVIEKEMLDTGLWGDPKSWIQTSYNTYGGVHLGPDGNPDGGTPLRKNFAAIGYTYNSELDAFIPPKPFPSWVLNEVSCLWNSPVPYPNDGNLYTWDEATQSWVEVTV